MTDSRKQAMSTKFKDFVDEVERNANDDERRLLDESRRRFGIGAKLLERRMAAGMSQRDLATAAGIDQAEISRIERGQGNPTAQTLQALGEPLGVTLDFSPLTTA
jgi:ribosome-binding protein aMBF1 (putative translation factor)